MAGVRHGFYHTFGSRLIRVLVGALSCRALERGPARPDRGPRRFGGDGEGGFGGREGYRREGGFGRGGGEDKAGAPGTYQPRFGGGGGFGRGAAAPPAQ